jgi:hypothetical protein
MTVDEGGFSVRSGGLRCANSPYGLERVDFDAASNISCLLTILPAIRDGKSSSISAPRVCASLYIPANSAEYAEIFRA